MLEGDQMKQYYQNVFQTIYDQNMQIKLLERRVSDFQPYDLSQTKDIPIQDKNEFMQDLKKRFPRDFGQKVGIGKRRQVRPNVVELGAEEFYNCYEKKRDRKSRRKEK